MKNGILFILISCEIGKAQEKKAEYYFGIDILPAVAFMLETDIEEIEL